MSVLWSVLIKQVDFKENVWSGTKKTVHNNKPLYEGGVRKASSAVLVFCFTDWLAGCSYVCIDLLE